jgi:hypothetical protein
VNRFLQSRVATGMQFSSLVQKHDLCAVYASAISRVELVISKPA